MKNNLKTIMIVLILLNVLSDAVGMVNSFVNKDIENGIVYIIFITSLIAILILYLRGNKNK